MHRIQKWENNCSVLRDVKFKSKYKLQPDIIGEGSFGTVITAKCLTSQQKRAVKAIRRIEKVSMLSIELQLLAELGGHFNIVKFYDFYHVLGSVAIVMEHFPHCSVGELVMFSRQDPSFGLLYFRNLLIAIAYLHQNDYVHRDIKLSNFLYSPKTNSFRLVDFGLATFDRSANEHKPMSIENHASCTVCSRSSHPCMTCKARPKRDAYHVVGTPGVRAPELLFGVGVCSPAVDIFSAGLCLLSLVALKHPLFMPKDETENIMDLACLLGSETMESIGKREGLHVTISEKRNPTDFCKLILSLRFGFENLDRFSAELNGSKCDKCAEISYGNVNSVCFCRLSEEKGKFSTTGISSELLVLYVDLLYRALEPDRFKRATADRLLGIIDYYDFRQKVYPRIEEE